MHRTADISPCGRFRWTLGRRWDDRPLLLVAMFNPSTASADAEDQTSSLLISIAAHNGFGAYTAVNLCPLRSSKPAAAIEMMSGANDRDPDWLQAMRDNLDVVEREIERSTAILLAWGSMGWRAGAWLEAFDGRLRDCRGARPIYRLGKCQNGHPTHPMARGRHKVPKDARLLLWEPY